MPRAIRSKPTNVVKSRSTPSLLGGYASPQVHLPSNRFVELGDIALGNSRRHFLKFGSNGPNHSEAEFSIEPNHSASEISEPPPQESQQPAHRVSQAVNPQKPPRFVPASRPKVTAAPLTRPKPPKPPAPTPQLSLPRKVALPKPPKVLRPKPLTGRPPSSATRRTQ